MPLAFRMAVTEALVSPYGGRIRLVVRPVASLIALEVRSTGSGDPDRVLAGAHQLTL